MSVERLRRLTIKLPKFGPSTRFHLFVVEAVFSILVWRLIWRPLGAVLALLTTSLAASHIRSNMPFWSNRAALVVGLMWGGLMAIFVRWLVLHSVHGVTGAAFLYLLGFTAVGYVGYGLPRIPNFPAETIIPMTAIVAYLIVVLVVVVVGFLR